jgi:hypothetical protein
MVLQHPRLAPFPLLAQRSRSLLTVGRRRDAPLSQHGRWPLRRRLRRRRRIPARAGLWRMPVPVRRMVTAVLSDSLSASLAWSFYMCIRDKLMVNFEMQF